MSYFEIITSATIKGVMLVEADSHEEAMNKAEKLTTFADPRVFSDEQGYEKVEAEYARELIGNNYEDLDEDYRENLEANAELLEEAESR